MLGPRGKLCVSVQTRALQAPPLRPQHVRASQPRPGAPSPAPPSAAGRLPAPLGLLPHDPSPAPVPRPALVTVFTQRAGEGHTPPLGSQEREGYHNSAPFGSFHFIKCFPILATFSRVPSHATSQPVSWAGSLLCVHSLDEKTVPKRFRDLLRSGGWTAGRAWGSCSNINVQGLFPAEAGAWNALQGSRAEKAAPSRPTGSCPGLSPASRPLTGPCPGTLGPEG